jgi:hypothetical protein
VSLLCNHSLSFSPEPFFFIAEPIDWKGHASFLFSRISYGAQELTVFLLENSPSDIKKIPVSESKQAFAFANYHNERERGKEVKQK